MQVNLQIEHELYESVLNYVLAMVQQSDTDVIAQIMTQYHVKSLLIEIVCLFKNQI